jgi:hypothetical protein
LSAGTRERMSALFLRLALSTAFCLGPAGCHKPEPEPVEEAGPLREGTGGSQFAKEEISGVVRLAGSPEEIGTRHGTVLGDRIRIMIDEYVSDDVGPDRASDPLLARVRDLKPALPGWYRRELAACAKAAGVDEDVLLYAQCEGDIKSLPGCTTYVAFGRATGDGGMEIGRSFDYWGLESTHLCAMVFAFVPRPEDGYAFVSVGWTGILGGWTFLNEKGLFVANNLGGFSGKNPKGMPTLILERILAQKAATTDEAIALLEKTPRMRGQALVIGHSGDPGKGMRPDAAVVLYDAARVEVRKQTEGFVSHSSVGTDPDRLLRMLGRARRGPTDTIRSVGNRITLHSVAIRPLTGRLWVAHGMKSSAHRGKYVEYDVRSLLGR